MHIILVNMLIYVIINVDNKITLPLLEEPFKTNY